MTAGTDTGSGADPGDPAPTGTPPGVERVLALWSPDWPVTAAARAAHVPAHRPAAVFHANRVQACSAPARSQGVRRGLRRREAQARCPDLAVLAPDTGRDARLFEPVVRAVEEIAPGVEVVRPGLLVLPARGPVGWFGGERAAAERLIDQVALRTRTECQVGVADGTFAAVLAARRGRGVPPGRSAEFLAPLEVAELDRDPEVDRAEMVDLLRRLGLRSLGAFAALPAADVASRFGADAVAAHRLARGLDPRPPARRVPPEELAAALELDPPVDRVDAAAFAARGLAGRLHEALAGHGLACTRLGVHARTEAGEELLRIWRCAEPLTPSGTVDRVRWQLDSWLGRGGSGALVALRLTPEETVVAGVLQRGLWGDVGEADERAGRALVRAQALLGPDAVVTPVLTGGRDPGERVRLVPWGEEREPDPPAPARRPVPDPPPAWPGRLPSPSPAVVPPEPVAVRLLAAGGAEVRPAEPDLLDAAPARLAETGRPAREVRNWAGPWPVGRRWWVPGGPGPTVRVQVVLEDGDALLLAHSDGRWWVTGAMTEPELAGATGAGSRPATRRTVRSRWPSRRGSGRTRPGPHWSPGRTPGGSRGRTGARGSRPRAGPAAAS